MGRYVTMSELAEVSGRSKTAIQGWLRRGCPVLEIGGGGKHYKFDLGEVIPWLEARARETALGNLSTLNIEDGRRRKVVAEAGIAEFDLAQRLGELVTIEDTAKIVADDYARVRARLLSLPSKIAPMIATLETPEECKDVVEGAICEALAELAAGDEPDDRDSTGGKGKPRARNAKGKKPRAKAAAKAKRKRVGRSQPTAQ